MADKKIVLAFDFYDTIVDTSSASEVLKAHAAYPSDIPFDKIIQASRTHLLQYTWRYTIMGLYVPMDVVVQNSLSHTLKAEGVAPSLHAGIISKVMEKYHSLDLFPDSAGFLQQLHDLTPSLTKTGARLDYVIFSNGTPKLVETAISSSDILTRTFAGDGTKKYVSVDGSKAYKPSPKVYKYLLEQLGVDRADGVYLVSANPFDIIGAKNAGLGTIWVNRNKTLGWVDMLLGEEDNGPDHEVQSLGGIVSLLTALG